jgi:two-component system, NarL family, nitrate/nitrite response regulator NarL
MFRDVVAQTLQREFHNAKIVPVTSFAEAMDAAACGPKVDLFLFDLHFPGMNGEASISQVRRNFSQSSIVIFTMFEHAQTAAKMIEAGADGYLGKGLSADQLLNDLARIRAGEFVVNISSAIQDLPLRVIERPMLTRRQIEILDLIQQKAPNKIIARELGLSHFTVRNHITVLMRALGVTKRDEITGRAPKLGITNLAGNAEHLNYALKN